MRASQNDFIPVRSPAEDIAALFSPEEQRRAADILCRTLAAGLDKPAE